MGLLQVTGRECQASAAVAPPLPPSKKQVPVFMNRAFKPTKLQPEQQPPGASLQPFTARLSTMARTSGLLLARLPPGRHAL